jgi:hypothetical protein
MGRENEPFRVKELKIKEVITKQLISKVPINNLPYSVSIKQQYQFLFKLKD